MENGGKAKGAGMPLVARDKDKGRITMKSKNGGYHMKTGSNCSRQGPKSA